MFPISELITTVVIENRLNFLKSNPDHLNWMLLPFVVNKSVGRLVDARYVAECVKYITTNKINIRPANEADLAKLPSIVIMGYQGEGQQFIGDYGGELPVKCFDPVTVATFDVIGFDGDTLKVPAGYNVSSMIWPNLWAKSGEFQSRILQVIDKGDETWINLKDAPPVGTPLRGWQATTSEAQKHYQINSSIDTVKVQVTLTTVGDHANHRLLCTVLRYCLKSGRLLFDDYGMQVATFNQQPVVLADAEQLIWQTPFMIEAKLTDHWISQEYLVDDSGSAEVTVVPDHNLLEFDNDGS